MFFVTSSVYVSCNIGTDIRFLCLLHCWERQQVCNEDTADLAAQLALSQRKTDCCTLLSVHGNRTHQDFIGSARQGNDRILLTHAFLTHS